VGRGAALQNCNPRHTNSLNGSDFIEIKQTLSFHSLENLNHRSRQLAEYN